MTPTPGASTIGRPPAGDLGLLAVAVLAASSSGPLIAATVAPPLAIALWRNVFASLLLAPFALLRRRRLITAISRRDLGLTLVGALLLSLHFATWVPALSYTSVASATALVATQPVWSAVIARARGASIGRQAWAGILLALSGVLVLTGADLQVSGAALAGDGLALLGGVFAAGYLAVSQEVRGRVSTSAYSALCYSLTSVLLLAVCLAGGQQVTGFAAPVWLKLVLLALVAQLLGHCLFITVLRTTSPTVVGVTILVEIPAAAALAALFLEGQELSWLAAPAALILVSGVVLVLRAGPRQPDPTRRCSAGAHP